MRAIAVSVVVVDSDRLQDAVNEVEVRLVVLHAVGERIVAAHQGGGVEVAEAAVREHLPHDLQGVFVLEDPAVGAELQERDPGRDRDAIQADLVRLTALLHGADQAAEEPISTLSVPHLDRQRPAEQGVDIDGGVIAQQFEIELKRVPERLPIVARLHLEYAGPQ